MLFTYSSIFTSCPFSRDAWILCCELMLMSGSPVLLNLKRGQGGVVYGVNVKALMYVQCTELIRDATARFCWVSLELKPRLVATHAGG